jgi:cold-inducible RNA-binding protein
MARRLYVVNLSYHTTEGALLDFFKQAGNVVSCDLIIDRNTDRSKGFAFVEMGSDQDASEAIAQLNGKELDGRALTVNEARPRPERPRSLAEAGAGGGHDDRRNRRY